MKGKIKSSLLKWAGRLTLACWLLHGATQLNYWRNDLVNAYYPNQIRREFKQQFGFSLRGWKADIEENNNFVSNVASAVRKEQLEKYFDLSCLRVESDNYFKKNLFSQIESLTSRPYAGFYMPEGVGTKIGLNGFSHTSIVHHEVKHRKADKYCDAEFYKKWEEIAKDGKGNSVYMGRGRTGLSRIILIGELFAKSKFEKDFEKQGFVSDYARTNVHEDIAETCTAAETSPERFVYWFYGFNPQFEKTPPNQRIIAKVRLAVEKGLIPREFEDFVRLKDFERKASSYFYSVSLNPDRTWLDNYLVESSRFLERHPDSAYECQIRSTRAWVLKNDGLTAACSESAENNRRGLKGTYERVLAKQMQPAIQEYGRALASSYKDGIYYLGALGGLEEVFKIIKSSDLEAVQEASTLYYKRHREGDVMLSIRGVNDYLNSHGLSFADTKLVADVGKKDER